VSVAGWRSFVAVGDSFTEGLDDRHPCGNGYRGWADLVAGALAAGAASAGTGGFRYANLAVRGRLFPRVVAEQVPPALAMRADLVSFAAGGNDVLRRGFEARSLVARFDAAVGGLRATGADVVVFRFADLTARLPGRRVIGPRVTLLNRAVGETAQRHGATLVDLSVDDEFANPALWSLDRLHLSSAGHRRVAAHVLTALGVAPDPEWWRAPGRPGARSWPAARAADLTWVGRHLVPWTVRRLTGRSSGDRVTAKRPDLAPLEIARQAGATGPGAAGEDDAATA
jgi:lysophospholipase L1-like esterase